MHRAEDLTLDGEAAIRAQWYAHLLCAALYRRGWSQPAMLAALASKRVAHYERASRWVRRQHAQGALLDVTERPTMVYRVYRPR